MSVHDSLAMLTRRDVQTSGRRPEHATMAPAIADELRRLMDRDRRLWNVKRDGLEFLLSMGLLVKDPSERVRVLIECVPFAVPKGIRS